MKDLIILGAGGAGWDIISLVNALNKEKKEWNILGFLDDNETLWGKSFLGIEVLGSIDRCNEYPNAYFVSSIANPTNRIIRRKIWDRVKQHGLKFATLVHPNVVVYDGAMIDEGCVVNANCVIGTCAHLYEDIHVGYGSNIAHETQLMEHTSLGSGVNLSSGVVIGSDCYIGAGVSSTHDIKVKPDTLVSVGSAIDSNATAKDVNMWIGVPAISDKRFIEDLILKKKLKAI
jgi:sugar O-acyltransferase (sialic acid O-acetyltransferase NeuD family)